ncbi:MAG: MEDS domain-containing protein, partial [Candidatus Bathyarchaeia archaeon]
MEHYRTSSKKIESCNGDQFSLTSDKAVTLNKIENLVDTAQSEIEYCTSREQLLQFMRYFSESLNHAVERGVKIRFISNPPNGEDELPSAINLLVSTKKSISIRYTTSLPNHFIIADNKEVLSATSTVGYLADNPMLWSNNAPHVMAYKKLFQELWDSSIETLSLNVISEVDKLKHFVKQMKPAEHVILLYETTKAKLKVLLNYIKAGLDNGEATVYVCSDSSVEEITDAVKQFGVDIKECQKSGALKIIDYTQHYIIDGVFDIENTAKLW